MKELQRWVMPVFAMVTAGALITACGTANGGTSNASGQSQAGAGAAVDPSADPSEEPSDPGAETGADGTTTTSVEAADDVKLGKIVVTDQGRTVYRFDQDKPNPPTSNCVEDCAKTWPPLVAGQDDVAVRGVDAKLLGKLQRADGTQQITLGGWPLYLYAKDTDPGDTKGQGVAEKWFASTPEGKKAGSGGGQGGSQGGGKGGGQGGGNAAADRWKGKLVLKVKNDPKLGKIVVDGEGKTLYRFDRDKVKPTVSNCLGQCAKAWPPVKFTSQMKLVGINKSQLTNIMRKDGICQVALNGRPLYRFAKDFKPGDTNGQGVGDTWFVSDPNGGKALGAGGSGGNEGGGGGGNGGGNGGGSGSGYGY